MRRTHPSGRGSLPVAGGEQGADHLRAGPGPARRPARRSSGTAPAPRPGPVSATDRPGPACARPRSTGSEVVVGQRISDPENAGCARPRRPAPVGPSGRPRPVPGPPPELPSGARPTPSPPAPVRRPARPLGRHQGGGDPDPAQVIVTDCGNPGHLRSSGREREPATGGSDGGGVVGDGAGGDVVAGGDLAPGQPCGGCRVRSGLGSSAGD